MLCIPSEIKEEQWEQEGTGHIHFAFPTQILKQNAEWT